MIRLKLFIGLFAAVLVLAIAGAMVMGVLKLRIDDFEKAFRLEYTAIRSLNEVRSATQGLNAHYLPLFAESSDYTQIGTDVLEEKIGVMIARIQRLKLGPEIKVLKESEIDDLRGAVQSYAQKIESVIQENNPENVRSLRREVLDKSRAIFNGSDEILRSLEKDLGDRHAHLRRSSSNTRVSMVIITVVSLLLAIIAYRSLTRGILGPVSHLTESIREVQKRNLDLSVPVKSRDELGDLNDAFNVMAAELRVLSLEHDEKIKKIDAENQAIIGNFPHPIVFLDTEGKVMKMNPRAEVLFSSLELIDGLPRRVRSLVNRAIEAKEEYLPQELFNSVLLRVDEKEYFYLPRIFEIHEDAGFDGWALVLTDVTKLRWIDDVKNNFLSTISHEIRTPLTSVRMILHLLAERKVGDLDEKQMEMIVSARGETDKLVDTITELLSTSRLEAGDEYLETRANRPCELIERSLENVDFSYHGDQYTVEVECSENLPQVKADEKGIGLVFENYIANAIRFSPVDKVINITAQKHSDQFVRFAVIDEGEGVPEELEESVFEKFVKGTAGAGGGVGLGLSISREIVHAHGGRVGLERKDDCTVFYFDLPIS